MVKKQRTSKAEAADVRMLYEKASQYKRAMEVAYSEGLWGGSDTLGINL